MNNSCVKSKRLTLLRRCADALHPAFTVMAACFVLTKATKSLGAEMCCFKRL